jgi:hypothetical protein
MLFSTSDLQAVGSGHDLIWGAILISALRDRQEPQTCLTQDRWCRGHDMNLMHTEYKPEMLLHEPVHWVKMAMVYSHKRKAKYCI